MCELEHYNDVRCCTMGSRTIVIAQPFLFRHSLVMMMILTGTMIMMILTGKMMMMMAFRQIPTMTKSHHGGNLSLMAMVGFCHQHIPTMVIHNDEAGLLI